MLGTAPSPSIEKNLKKEMASVSESRRVESRAPLVLDEAPRNQMLKGQRRISKKKKSYHGGRWSV